MAQAKSNSSKQEIDSKSKSNKMKPSYKHVPHSQK